MHPTQHFHLTQTFLTHPERVNRKKTRKHFLSSKKKFTPYLCATEEKKNRQGSEANIALSP